MMKTIVFDTVIIGGGASGMMAAVTAGRQKEKVLLIEQKEIPGKKILATGNGKCNYTNADMEPSHFHGDPELIRTVLENFDHEKTIQFFHELGVYPRNKNGYYYPMSEQAASVAAALRRELDRTGVVLACGEKVTGIRREKNDFSVKTEKNSYRAGKVIIACGLKAAPKLGSDGSLLPLLTGLGHHVKRPVPALCGFYAGGLPFKKVAGVRVEAGITLQIDGEESSRDQGELQLTDYGISGIPVFQISSPASRALEEGRCAAVSLNFLPALTKEAVDAELQARYQRGKISRDPAESLLLGLLPDKLALVLMEAAGINPADCLLQLPRRKVDLLCQKITGTQLTLKKARDFEFAQVCGGGIPAGEVNKDTLESRLIPGLFFCGEVLDVDGICGGYNLQWAWSSGYTAAKGKL